MVVPSHLGWGRATTLLSVLEVRHGSLDSTPAQDSVSSLGGLREEAALWEKFNITMHPTQTGCLFETLGIPPVLKNQVSLRIASLGPRGVLKPLHSTIPCNDAYQAYTGEEEPVPGTR